MNNQTNSLEIKNFKSIKEMYIVCKKINIFIGKPNVGKSNILEALALFCAPYSSEKNNLHDFIRYDTIPDLFYFQNTEEDAEVRLNLLSANTLRYHERQKILEVYQMDRRSWGVDGGKEFIERDRALLDANLFMKVIDSWNAQFKTISETIFKPFYLQVMESFASHSSLPPNGYECPIKKYEYKKGTDFSDDFSYFLKPPFGENLSIILDKKKELAIHISDIFNENGYQFNYSKKEKKWKIQRIDGYLVYDISLSMVADTILRYAFHLAAIESNRNSILLFEEPEAHCYPPYISLLTDKIIDDKYNQYFIATHSPTLLNTFIEHGEQKDIAIHVVTYDKHQTLVKTLNDDEVSQLMNYKVDILSNLSSL